MRLFLYYMGHSFVNVLKKIFKTWLAFFFIIFAIAMLIGFVGGSIAKRVESRNRQETAIEETVEAEVTDEQEKAPSILEIMNISKENMVETIMSGIFFFMLFLTLLNSKGIGEIFLPADVPMLFASPLRPQSVMMFRLAAALGLQVLLSFYMAFQIPNLILNAHMNAWGAWSILVAWLLLALLTTVLQILLYIFASKNDFFKKNLKIFIGAFFVALIAIYFYFLTKNDRVPLKAATEMFSGANTFWVPFWGWMRGMTINALAGNVGLSLMYVGLNIAGILLLIVIAWNIKVDYYEDAVISTERRAEIIERAQNSKGAATIRTKDRSSKIKRDGFTKGSGATVFYHKTIYNRRRLSYFGCITKTMLLYLVIAAFSIGTEIFGDFKYCFVLYIGITLVMVFYRTLGNPLREDITKEFFVMIPAKAVSKLFWSMLGGIINTAMDLIVPFAAVVIWLKVPPVQAIVWFLFIITVDIYGTVIGTFIYLSVSVSLPDMVQNMVQVVFIYFGVIPAIIAVILGIVFNRMMLFLPIGLLFNLIVSAIFFFITPVFLENGRK